MNDTAFRARALELHRAVMEARAAEERAERAHADAANTRRRAERAFVEWLDLQREPALPFETPADVAAGEAEEVFCAAGCGTAVELEGLTCVGCINRAGAAARDPSRAAGELFPEEDAPTKRPVGVVPGLAEERDALLRSEDPSRAGAGRAGEGGDLFSETNAADLCPPSAPAEPVKKPRGKKEVTS